MNVNQNPQKSLSLRLTIALSVVILLFVGTINGFFYVTELKDAALQAKSKLGKTKGYLEGSLTGPLWNMNTKGVQSIVDTVMNDEATAAVKIFSESGELQYSREKEDGSDSLLTTNFDLFYQNEKIASVELAVSKRKFEEAVYEKHKGSLITLGLGVIVIILLTGYLVRHYLSQSIHDIDAILERYGMGDFSKPLQATTYVEFQLVQDGVAKLGERIEKQLDQLQQYQHNLQGLVDERTKDLVIARDQAEAANQSKSIFLSTMSHELRTPLNAILGFSQLMQRDQALPDKEREHIDIINRSGVHLLQLINDVLDMSKIETGQVKLQLEDFDLGELVRDTVDMMQVRSLKKGLQLVLDQSSDFPRFIHGDAPKLRQILINLLTNAVKFTQSGSVTLKLDAENDGKGGLILLGKVQDTGCGIEQEYLEHIFQPFEQLVELNSQKGTGLGLAITRQFVEMMQGEIGVGSTPGEGSLFHFKVLVEPAKGEVVVSTGSKQHQVVGLEPGQPECRILIAEDQPENAMLLQHILEPVGFTLQVANNGKEAVEQFQHWHPHLIWMDRRMPVMDGEKATKEIRKLPGGDKVKIVALTASAFQEEKDKIMSSGMDDYISKPFRPEELFDCMARHLDLNYRYREAEEGMPQEPTQPIQLDGPALNTLTEAFLEELLEVVEAGDGVEAMALINTLEKEHCAVGVALTHLVENFYVEQLVTLLRAVLDDRKS